MKKSFSILILGLILLGLPIVFADQISYDDFECNAFNCGTGWNGAWSYSGTCTITTLSSPQGIYQMRGEANCIATRNFNNADFGTSTVSFWATATSLEAGDYCRYYYYDGSTYTQLLQITDGGDTGTLQYYTYNVTPLSSNAGIRMTSPTTTGDYCYIDTITTSGTLTPPSLNIFMDAQYPVGKTNVEIDMTSNIGSTEYTLQLYNSTGGMFCNKTATSPATPSTMFSVYCDMPNEAQNNAYALMFQTSNPSINQTDYFNIITPIHDSSKLSFTRVYYSPQVLQGGSTEIFALLTKDPGVTITNIYTEVTFPDNSTRKLSMEPTVNANEYRAYITDTYRTGNTSFTVVAEGGVYYAEYTNQYFVAPYNIDFVDTVNRVDEILSQPPHLMVAGTDYYSGEPGKAFFQLSENGVAVDNASCFITVYYPNVTVWVEDQLMINNGDHGLQYYPFIAPDIEGIYMISAACQYYSENQWYYEQDGIEYPEYTQVMADYSLGSVRNLVDFEDNLYQEVNAIKSGGSYYIDQEFLFNNTNYNFTDSWLVYSGESTAAVTQTFYYWNWGTSAWVALPYTLLYAAQVNPQALEPVETDQYLSNPLPNNAYNTDGSVKIRLYTVSNQDFVLFHNWLNIIGEEFLTDVVSNLRGGGEIHISNAAKTMVDYFETIVGFLNSTKTHTQFVTSNTYNLNETGIIATRLTYSNGDFEYAEIGASCNIIGRGPANSTIGPIIYNSTMTELGSGTYYYNFTPEHLGIYESEVTCTAGVNETYREYNAITQYRVEDDITSISIEGLSNLIEEMNLAFFDVESNITPFTIGGIYQEYLNETVAMIFSGTEYNSGEEGAIQLQLLKSVAAGGNSPLTGLVCNSTIYYPDFNGIFESKIMTENINGIYSHNFTVPTEEGVYIDAVLCLDGTKTYYGMHTFHVAPWANQAFANNQTLNDIYNLVTFINSTTIEINGTTHNIESYLQTTIFSLLTDINWTVNNLDINVTVDLSSIETRLDSLQQIIVGMDEFSQEQIFLITDSVGQVKQISKDTYASEQDIKETLKKVESNLQRFQQLSTSKIEEAPSRVVDGLDSSILILVGSVLFIIVLSKKSKGDKPKEKVEPAFNLPTFRDRDRNIVKGEKIDDLEKIKGGY